MSNFSYQDWLDSLKDGDKVTTNATYRYIYTIDHVTKTKIVLTNGNEYKRRDGYVFGSTARFNRLHLAPVTNDVHRDISLRNVVSRINTPKVMQDITLNQLIRILSILDETT